MQQETKRARGFCFLQEEPKLIVPGASRGIGFGNSNIENSILRDAKSRVCLAAAPSGLNMDHRWYVDSCANVVVVGVNDSCVIHDSISDTFVSLRTSGGIVKARAAKINTPFGIEPGLVSHGSPRLLPLRLIEQHGWFHSESGVSTVCFRGVQVICERVNDIPALPSNAFDSGNVSTTQPISQNRTAAVACANDEQNEHAEIVAKPADKSAGTCNTHVQSCEKQILKCNSKHMSNDVVAAVAHAVAPAVVSAAAPPVASAASPAVASAAAHAVAQAAAPSVFFCGYAYCYACCCASCVA